MRRYTPEEALEAHYRKLVRLRTWVKGYRTENPEKHLLWLAKARAKRKSIEFSLVEADIIIPEYCPYLGIKLVPTVHRGESRNHNASLDRIDNNKGYTKDNIEVISWQANTMKNNATTEQLISFAKEILKRHTFA